MATKRQPVERSDEIEKFMRRWYQATVDGDLDTIAEAISDDPGVTFVGTDADEWWEGKEKCVAMYRTQIAEADSESFIINLRPGVLACFESGTIGWCYDNPTVTTPYGEEIEGRLTAVLHLEGMSWRVVHLHGSFGQPNAETFGKVFTTNIDMIADSIDNERPDLSALAIGDGTVTIVFTDIEASTEIAERLGNRGYVDLLRWHDDIVRELAAASNGTVVKSQGDGYMLVFTSASSALEFSSRLCDRSSAGYLGQPVRVRIGLNSGDVVRERDDFFGRAVTVAARVAGQAQGGEVLLTELVAALVAGSDQFTFGPLRVATLKGFDGEFALRPLVLGAPH